MHRCDPVQSKEASDQSLRELADMLIVGRQQVQQNLHLTLSHSLDQEALVLYTKQVYLSIRLTHTSGCYVLVTQIGCSSASSRRHRYTPSRAEVRSIKCNPGRCLDVLSKFTLCCSKHNVCATRLRMQTVCLTGLLLRPAAAAAAQPPQPPRLT